MVNLKESRRRTDGPSAHTNRRRVAIAVFDTAQAIRRAIAGLEAIGILLDRMMIVLDPARCYSGLADLLDRPAEADGLPAIAFRETARHMALAGPPREGRGGLAAPSQMARFEDWAAPRLSRELDAHLNAGAAVLTVGIQAPELEPQVFGILLACSIDGVQLHDLAMCA